MKKNVKKIVTIVLAFCIMVSAMCLSVFAAEARATYIKCPLCETGNALVVKNSDGVLIKIYCDNCGEHTADELGL